MTRIRRICTLGLDCNMFTQNTSRRRQSATSEELQACQSKKIVHHITLLSSSLGILEKLRALRHSFICTTAQSTWVYLGA